MTRHGLILLIVLGFAAELRGQKIGVGSYGKAVAEPSRQPNFDSIGIDQNLGGQVPLDLVFRDERNREVTLGSLVGGKPTILILAYYRCPQLCNQVLNAVVECLREMTYDVGEQFNVVTVSFDPKDRPPIAYDKRASYLEFYGRPGADRGWHFLTGDQKAIDALCTAVGFRYDYDNQRKQYNHASGIMILTPHGILSKYFYGLIYSPEEVKQALDEAGGGRVGQPVEPSKMAQLLCLPYDPHTAKYTLSVMKILRAAAAVTALAVIAWLFFAWRKRRPIDAAPSAAATPETSGVGEGGADAAVGTLPRN